MRKKVLFGLLIMVVAVTFTGCKLSSKEKIINMKQIDSDIVEFNYSYGSYNNGYYNYDIANEEGKFILTAVGYNGVDLNVKKEINKSYLEQLSKIINDNMIYSWNGFHGSNDGVLDGYSFSLKIIYKNGETIEASGYSNYPKNYDECHKILKEFFSSIK